MIILGFAFKVVLISSICSFTMESIYHEKWPLILRFPETYPNLKQLRSLHKVTCRCSQGPHISSNRLAGFIGIPRKNRVNRNQTPKNDRGGPKDSVNDTHSEQQILTTAHIRLYHIDPKVANLKPPSCCLLLGHLWIMTWKSVWTQANPMRTGCAL